MSITDVKRYDVYWYGSKDDIYLDLSESGDYVYYEDVVKALANQEKRFKRALAEKEKYIMDLQNALKLLIDVNYDKNKREISYIDLNEEEL